MFSGIFSQSSQANTSQSGLVEFNWNSSTYAPPLSGLTDGKRWSNSLLRASVEQNPSGLTTVAMSGKSLLQFYVDPRVLPASTDPTYPYHFRAEFSEWPWKAWYAVGTEEWLGWSYIFPSDWKRPIFPTAIFQNYVSVDGDPTGGPAFYMELAGSGQTIGGYYCQGGELQIINRCENTNTRYVVQSPQVYRPQAGDRLDFVMQVVYGDATGSTAILRIWINGDLVHNTTDERTVWINKGNANYLGGNNKWGLYCHSNRTLEDIEASENAGINYAKVLMTPLKRLRRFPGMIGYGSADAFGAVSTANY